jgi:cell division protein FtsI (penicillin-binding protein 3)
LPSPWRRRKVCAIDEPISIGNGLKLGHYLIHDFERLGPTLSAAMVFAQSSNIGTAQIEMRSGPTRQKPFLKRLGLLEPLKTELPEIASPLYPRHWEVVEAATIAYGHGISVNPLGRGSRGRGQWRYAHPPTSLA